MLEYIPDNGAVVFCKFLIVFTLYLAFMIGVVLTVFFSLSYIAVYIYHVAKEKIVDLIEENRKI